MTKHNYNLKLVWNKLEYLGRSFGVMTWQYSTLYGNGNLWRPYNLISQNTTLLYNILGYFFDAFHVVNNFVWPNDLADNYLRLQADTLVLKTLFEYC